MSAPRVIVVEDVRHMAHFVKRSLERAGYEVLCVYDGAEALPAIEEYDPQAVVLDVVLPGMSGIEICRALRDDPRHRKMPVVIVTGHSFEDAGADEIRAAGADWYFTKPVSPLSLRGKLAELGVGTDVTTPAPPAEASRPAPAKGTEVAS